MNWRGLTRRGLRRFFKEETPPPTVLLQPSGAAQGLVGMSYLRDPLRASPDDLLLGHSNRWECRDIAHSFLTLGYAVEGIDWNDRDYVPTKPLAALFDIDLNLQRIAPFLSDQTIKLLHLTGSYGPFQNQAELARVDAFEARTGKLYSPKRMVANIDLVERSLRLADRCSLIGNAEILATYPKIYRDKITMIPVSGSWVTQTRSEAELTPVKREFVWFFGGGAVHKGLDLVIDFFVARPDLTLHIVGSAATELDFMAAYETKLSLPHIHYHGTLDPNGSEFREKLANVFCFIAPSCSEGTSPAAVTCMQFGFLPIISRQTGVTLPPDCGFILESLSVEAIAKAVDAALALTTENLRAQIKSVQLDAQDHYSRRNFHATMHDYLAESMKGRQAWV